ncbi:MAG: S-layer homology domain-containing protein [Oscillospiraceae bacterium]|nr:S-layer homology domain-containing protein [Oscillospiraceae bacterium]
MKKQTIRRLIGAILVLVLLVGILPTSVFAASAQTPQIKRVTAWDETTAELKLQFPSMEQSMSMDIVFVFDKSQYSDTLPQALALLDELKAQADAAGASVKVGIVKFFQTAVISPFRDLATEYDDIKADTSTPSTGGTNMHAGLLAAKELLESDTTVPDSRKYMILVSDGSTYLWSKETTGKKIYETHYTRTYATTIQEATAHANAFGGYYDEYLYLPSAQGNTYGNVARPMTPDPALWQAYLDDVAARNSESNGDQYDFDWNWYDLSWFIYGNGTFTRLFGWTALENAANGKWTTQPRAPRTASNIDMAFYYADQVYQQLKAKYNTFSVAVRDKDTGVLNHRFMNYLNGGKAINFDYVEKDILYSLGAGSRVEDYMSEKFDFVNDPSTIKLNVLDASGNIVDTYAAETIASNHYGFAPDTGLTSGYMYELVYDSAKDMFTWTTNVNITSFRQMQLVYSAKFSATKETTPGTYGVDDWDGDGKEDKAGNTYSPADALYTNTVATLYPVDSNGTDGQPEDFPMPSVSYTVQQPDTATLKLTKTTVGATTPAGTRFTISGTPSDQGVTFADVTVTYADIEDGKWEMSVPVGTYKVVENESDAAVSGYTLTVGGDNAKAKSLAKNETVTLSIINNYRQNTPGTPPTPELNTKDHYAYIIGYPDGEVKPEGMITRAETVTIFFRMLTDESRDAIWSTSNSFTDVKASDWFNNAISTMENGGIIKGYPNGSFRPNDSITRAEFAAMAIRFFKDAKVGPSKFSDTIGHWAEEAISKAQTEGLVAGYPDGTFHPDQPITRAEAMTIVNRVLKRAPHKDHLLDDMIKWPDNMDKSVWYYADVQEATNSHTYTMSGMTDGVYEIWQKLRPVRDWEAFEKMWSTAHSAANPGEVVNP